LLKSLLYSLVLSLQVARFDLSFCAHAFCILRASIYHFEKWAWFKLALH